MPDKTDPPTDQGTDDAKKREDEFWGKLDTHLDSWLERKTKEANDQRARETPSQGTSRTGAKRVTLPSLIADIVFGPPKD